MKILFLSNLYAPNLLGGYERLCFEVATEMVARGHEVSVLTSTYGGKVADYPGQSIVRKLKMFATEGALYIPFECSAEDRAAWEAQNSEALKRTVEEIQPDVIFVWNLYFLNVGLLNALQSLPQRKVFMLTDNWLIAFLNPEFIGEYFRTQVFNKEPLDWKKRLRGIARKLLGRGGHGGAGSSGGQPGGHAGGRVVNGKAIFASQFMHDLYQSAGFTLSDGYTISYHGVMQQPRAPQDYTDRRRLVREGELNLLFAGRITEIKGVHTALDALPLIQKSLSARGLKVVLTIVGGLEDHTYVDRLKEQIASLNLQDSVVFRASVPEPELFGLFQEYDIYLFPSLYEPFSLTLIHGLAAGIPTVASKAGGNVEIVEHKETGMLFETSDAVDMARQVGRLATDAELRARVAREGAKRASTFTVDRMISRIEDTLTGRA